MRQSVTEVSSFIHDVAKYAIKSMDWQLGTGRDWTVHLGDSKIILPYRKLQTDCDTYTYHVHIHVYIYMYIYIYIYICILESGARFARASGSHPWAMERSLPWTLDGPLPWALEGPLALEGPIPRALAGPFPSVLEGPSPCALEGAPPYKYIQKCYFSCRSHSPPHNSPHLPGLSIRGG